MSPEKRLARINERLTEYYQALNRREHGGVSQGRFVEQVETILGRGWQRNEGTGEKGRDDGH